MVKQTKFKIIISFRDSRYYLLAENISLLKFNKHYFQLFMHVLISMLIIITYKHLKKYELLHFLSL